MNSHCLTATGYLRTSNEVNGPSWCWSTGDNVIIFVPISVNVAQRRRRSINWPQPRETAFFSFLIRHKPRPSCVWNQVMREIRVNETAQCRSLWSVPHGYDTGLILQLDRPDVEAGQQQTADFLWFLCFEFFVFFFEDDVVHLRRARTCSPEDGTFNRNCVCALLGLAWFCITALGRIHNRLVNSHFMLVDNVQMMTSSAKLKPCSCKEWAANQTNLSDPKRCNKRQH